MSELYFINVHVEDPVHERTSSNSELFLPPEDVGSGKQIAVGTGLFEEMECGYTALVFFFSCI